jgi:poly(A) RNA polymerase GLD2
LLFQLDWRVQPLVLVIKSWAKQAEINDARNQTLSSYTLTLMVLHFLQASIL